ncbi:hypothetical protein G9A89_010543 [Geosiphon pyriformis]|nr:hypothetical protein G9A89_010543 [Geosiphon pyriformis]
MITGIIESSTESTRAQSPFECQISPSFLPQNTLPADLKYTKIHTQIFTGNIESFCFLPDNRHLVVGIREDNYLHYIKYNPYSPSSSINPSSSFTTTKYNMNSTGDDWISFTPMHISPSPHNNGSYLLVSTDSSSQNGRLILFKTHSSKQLRNFYGIEVDRFSTPKHCWHPSGAYFYAGEDTGDICVFGVAEGKILKRLKGHHGAIKGLWFDWERNFLVSCSLDRTICVWGHECGG